MGYLRVTISYNPHVQAIIQFRELNDSIPFYGSHFPEAKALHAEIKRMIKRSGAQFKWTMGGYNQRYGKAMDSLTCIIGGEKQSVKVFDCEDSGSLYGQDLVQWMQKAIEPEKKSKAEPEKKSKAEPEKKSKAEPEKKSKTEPERRGKHCSFTSIFVAGAAVTYLAIARWTRSQP